MITKEKEIAGRKLELTAGYMAKQADGSVVARYGDTVVLATAVMGGKREGMDYFPLLVDYEERLYAAGKIKGSRFIKREGRPTDDAVLTGRLIDRGLRPLFEDGMRNDVQVVVTVLSVDEENDAAVLACNAASAALAASKIPWNGPLATVRVGKLNGEYILNPTYAEQVESSLDLVLSSTGEHILMIEVGANLVDEAEIVGAARFAEKYIKELIELQKEFIKDAGVEKVEAEIFGPRDEIKEMVQARSSEISDALYSPVSKTGRNELLSETKDAIVANVVAKFPEEPSAKSEAKAAFEKEMKEIIRRNILENEKRVDGRPLDQTREVSAMVGVLPRTHGSALFQRGETQVLTVVTLGSAGDEQILDGMEDFVETKKRYIHHYNFPGYSVGEVSPNRGPGRREIGHGALAERALEPAIPGREEFPYTMRLVSEALGSNGSTSMASTCGSSLALMDAGVPVKEVIGGVAMGLVLDTKTGDFKVLTDILGMEDGNGDMDFKVTGSETGITAIQLDVKTQGLTVDILEQALGQAKQGRLHILSVMKAALPAPRTELNKYAPRIISFHINPEKIRTVIGSGGKTINEIIAATGVKIDIEDDGLVMIASADSEAAAKAEQWIQDLVRDVEVGKEYKGKVVRIMDFGAFVEILPGKDGMVHVSKLKADRVENVADVVSVGDELDVIVTEIDSQGRVNLITKEAKEAGKSGEREDRPQRSGGSRPPRDRGPRRN